MDVNSSDIEVLDRAIGAIEQVLDHIRREVDLIQYASGPAQDGEQEIGQSAVPPCEEPRTHRAHPEQCAAHFCLTAAGALIDVGQTLVRSRDAGLTPQERQRYLRSLAVRAKAAGRMAYRATLVLSDNDNGLMAHAHALAAAATVPGSASST
jgi:hypothetical protein